MRVSSVDFRVGLVRRWRLILLLMFLVVGGVLLVKISLRKFVMNQAGYGQINVVRGDKEITDIDVVVYGGGVSGAMAAYQAARLGKQVVLLEPTQWLGGQVSAAGVGTLDLGWGYKELSFGWIKKWLGYVDKVYRNYGDSDKQKFAQCYWSFFAPGSDLSSVCIEPKVANEAFKLMLKEPDVAERLTVIYGVELDDNPVIKLNNKVVGLRLKDGERSFELKAKVVVDASEYGDLIPLTGASFYVGKSGELKSLSEAKRWARANLNKPNGRIQSITYVGNMRKKNESLPDEIKSLYNYKIRDIFPKLPLGYEKKWNSLIVPSEPDDTCKWFDPSKKKGWGFYYHARYRAVGDAYLPFEKLGLYKCRDGREVRWVTKFGVNQFNDLPTYALFLVDDNYRKKTICEAKKKTLANIAYLESVRLKGGNDWYLSREDFCQGSNCYSLREFGCGDIPDNIEKNLALEPYVRESIRPKSLFGDGQYKRSEVSRGKARYADSVAISTYAFDLHDDSVSKGKWVTGPFQMPLKTFIVVDRNNRVIEGFTVAEKNLGVDRFVQGSIRVQPSAMLVGQAAGVIAALAADRNGLISQVKAVEVQDKLTSMKAKSKISPYYYQDIDYTNFSEAYKYSELMSNLGLMIGYHGKWFPNGMALRSHFAVVLVKLGEKLGIKFSKIREYKGFDDVRGCWCEPFVRTLYESGITNGCGGGKFCANRGVTASEAVVFLTKLLSLKKELLVARSNECNVVYPPNVPNWSKFGYDTLVRAGLLDIRKNGAKCWIQNIGDGNKSMTRLEMAKLVWEVFRKVEN